MKSITPIFEADVVNGELKILPITRKAIARWVQTFKTGDHLEIIIRKHKSKRSQEQNRYYWGVVIKTLGDHFGYDPEEMHEEMKLMFNPIRSKIDPARKIGGSTTKMDTIEFYGDQDSYVERICRWAASEHGLYVPPPKACIAA